MISALPEDLAALVDHVEVTTVDEISLVLKDGRPVVWGSADESDTKATCSPTCSASRRQTYDVSVPGQPTTAESSG